MDVYLNRVYQVRDKVVLWEILIFNNSYNYIAIVDDTVAIKSKCRKMREDGYRVHCLDSNGEIIMNKETIRRTYCTFETLPNKGIYKSTHMMSVYDLYHDLNRYNCIYQDKEHAYPDGYVGAVSYFDGLKTHTNSMAISIDVIKDGKVLLSRDLIAHNSDIEQQKFDFLVPVKYVSKFSRFGVENKGVININGSDYAVMSYGATLAIYTIPEGKHFVFPESVIIKVVSRHASLGLQDKLYEKIAKLYPQCDDKMPENPSLGLTSMFNDKNGVFLHHEGTEFTDKDLDSLVIRIQDLVKEIPVVEDFRPYVTKELIHSKFSEFTHDRITLNAIRGVILGLLKSGAKDVVTLSTVHSELRTKRVFYDILLYRFRADLYIRGNQTISAVGGVISDLVQGDTKITMEVWL